MSDIIQKIRCKKASIKLMLSLSFIFLIIVTFILVGYVAFSNWKTSSGKIIKKAAAYTNSDILKQMDYITTTPLNINNINHNIIESKLIDIKNRKQREMYFAGVIKAANEEVYSFTYGMEDGEYYGARRNQEGNIEITENNKTTQGRSFYYSINSNLTSEKLVEKTLKFDCRTRDWYKIAKQEHKPVFSPIYKHFVIDDLAISASYPIYDKNGSIEGVLGTHIILSRINNYLSKIAEEQKAKIYIVEKDTGALVGNSDKKKNFKDIGNGQIKRYTINDISNKYIRNAYKSYKYNSPSKLNFQSTQDNFYITIMPYHKDGLNWIIVSAVDQSQFTSDIIKSIKQTSILSLLTILLAIIIYINNTNQILRPIYNLIHTAKGFSNGNFTKRAIVYKNDEIGALAKVFNSMADSINMLFDNLEEKVKERTAKLEEANNDLKNSKDDILYLSYHDQLTGLFNRRYFEEEWRRMDNLEYYPLTIIMADMNGLKLINDSLGHAAGDEMLKKAASILKRGCCEDELVARLGGDEFVIVLPNTDRTKGNKIVDIIKELASHENFFAIDISFSLGLGTKYKQDEKLEDIFKIAEDNMYSVKLFESQNMRRKAISGITAALHEKSVREYFHSNRVAELSSRIGEAAGLSQLEIEELKTAGLLHDIGKIIIKDSILNKKGQLTKEEFDEVKRHSEVGYRILNASNDFSSIARFVLSHHERIDGKGYPNGLKGKDIPLQSRILSIADAYDAMTTDRSYSKTLTSDEAVEELKRNAGTQFDAELVEIFIEKILKK